MNESSEYDDEERIQHEDDIFTLCAAVEEYKESVEALQTEVLRLSTRNNVLASQNEALLARDIEHVSNIDALEEAMTNLLEELSVTAKHLQARDDDVSSLQACLNAVHRRKIDVDDLTKQQQSDLIEKLQIENELLSSSKKSNKDMVAHYDEVINDKNSEILDLKDRIRELEAEKREYLNSFKRIDGGTGGYSSEEEKGTDKEHKRSTPPRSGALSKLLKAAGQPASSGTYKDKISMLSDFGSSLLSSTGTVNTKPTVVSKKEPHGRRSELHTEPTTPEHQSSSSSAAAPGSGVKLREITVDSSTAASHETFLPTLTVNPVRRTPPRKSHQHHHQLQQHRHQHLNSSYSEDEYRSASNKNLDKSRQRHSRSAAFSSADDNEEDGESDDMRSPVELTIRRATNAIRNNKKNRQDSQWRALHSGAAAPTSKQQQESWQNVNKHANIFKEAKVVKKPNNQSEDEFENIVIPFDKQGTKAALRKNSNGLLVNTLVLDGSGEDTMRSGAAAASKYNHK